MQIFTERELELLISGLPEIDADEWRANTGKLYFDLFLIRRFEQKLTLLIRFPLFQTWWDILQQIL